MKNNVILEEKYSNEDVLKAVNKLSEEERGVLLASLQIPQIRNYLNDPKECEKCIDNLVFIANFYKQVAETIEKMKDNMDSLLQDDAKDFSVDYNKLGETEKEYATVALLNNDEFKKNCFNILEHNFKKLINSDEVMVALDKALGLSKIYKKCLDMGRKSDYTYEV